MRPSRPAPNCRSTGVGRNPERGTDRMRHQMGGFTMNRLDATSCSTGSEYVFGRLVSPSGRFFRRFIGPLLGRLREFESLAQHAPSSLLSERQLSACCGDWMAAPNGPFADRAKDVHVAGFRVSFPVLYALVYGFRLSRNAEHLNARRAGGCGVQQIGRFVGGAHGNCSENGPAILGAAC